MALRKSNDVNLVLGMITTPVKKRKLMETWEARQAHSVVHVLNPREEFKKIKNTTTCLHQKRSKLYLPNPRTGDLELKRKWVLHRNSKANSIKEQVQITLSTSCSVWIFYLFHLGKLKNKVAIITGADSGIGRAVAVMFAKEG